VVAGDSAGMAFGRSARDRLKTGGRLPRRLAVWRRAARLLLVFEAVWPVIWPPLGFVGVYFCAALLDLPQRLGRPLNTLMVLADLVAAMGALAIGVWRIRWPNDAAAQFRLRTASGLAHDPIAALEDTPAQTDPASLAVWQAHRERSLAAAKRLRLQLPWPWLTRRDRFLLRGGLIAALLLCAWLAGPAARSRLDEAFTLDPALLLGGSLVPPTVTAWITPPAYTGRAPILLPGRDAKLSVPAGSRLTVTVAGVGRAPTLAGEPGSFQALDGSSFQLDSTLTRSGLMTLRGGGERLARWQITALVDRLPSIGFAGQPGPDADGISLRLPWHAKDDYGVVSAQMTARLLAQPAAPPLTVPLAMLDGPSPAIDAVQITDLSANPWAGLPVGMHLTDKDALSQQGESSVLTVILPERRFSDPLAQQVIAIRKGLVQMPDPQDPGGRGAAGHALFEIGAAAELAHKSAQSVLPLMAAAWQLADDRGTGAVPAVIDQLWQVALHFEQGEAADTAQSLRSATDALKNALRSPSATSADLARLMQAVQAAVLQHLSTLMQMAQHQGGVIGTPSGERSLDLSTLARQMQAMEAAAKAGDFQAMRQDLAALEKSLQALAQARVVKPDPAQEAAHAQAEKDLATLQSMMRQQGQLLDHSTQRADAEQPDPMGEQRDAAAQAALRRALGSLSARLGASVNGPGQAMGQAVQRLRTGQDAQAARAQQQALFDLQQAANALGQRLTQQPGQGGGIEIGGGRSGEQPGGQPEDGFSTGNGETDPLGRPLSTGQGASLGADVALPNGSDQAQLRAILQELRNRAGDRNLSQPELDYIERLLQPF
jgi:uncharacterized protein (TIGR02302 family)